jgi:hypothetical protein
VRILTSATARREITEGKAISQMGRVFNRLCGVLKRRLGIERIARLPKGEYF